MNIKLPPDQFDAFIQYGEPYLKGAENKILSQYTFGVKDIFDIAGFPTAFGSPDWKKSHPIPNKTAPVILDLLGSGATLLGKTHTDELTYSILGINAHYGTPINPLSPNRVPGGSSSGSAVAVAGKLVDFSIGSDTGGSIRVPASFCGIYGMRPTHGRISLAGAKPLAKSFDTLGWFARDSHVLNDVGKVLLNKEVPEQSFSNGLLLPEQAWELIPDELKIISLNKIQTIFKGWDLSFSNISEFNLNSWADTFRIIQASEVWEEHGNWAGKYLSKFGPGIKERFLYASKIDAQTTLEALKAREKIQALLSSLTSKKLLLIPTVSNFPPLLSSTESQLDEFRRQSQSLLCIAGLGGLPEISMPVISTSEGSLGISIIGPKYSDEGLLDLLKALPRLR